MFCNVFCSAKVTLLALNHEFSVTVDQTLDDFQPEVKLQRFGPLSGVILPPFAGRRFYMVCPDEESSAMKCFNFSADCKLVGLCTATDPEEAHPRWNSWKRTIGTVGAMAAVMKATTMCNKSHGVSVLYNNIFWDYSCFMSSSSLFFASLVINKVQGRDTSATCCQSSNPLSLTEI